MTALATASIRLRLIIIGQGIPVTFREVFSLTFIGYFFNNFLPTAIGGDVVKAYYLSKKTHYKIASYTSVFVDRAIGLFTMIFMAFIALLFVGSDVLDKNLQRMIYVITGLAAFALVFLFNKNVARKFSGLLALVKPMRESMTKLYDTIHAYQHQKMLICKVFLISIVSQLLFYASIGILAFAIGSRVTTMDILLRMPIISAMSLIPSINGLGVREGSTVLVFGPLIGNERAFAVSVLWLVILLITSVLGGLVYAFSPQFKVKLKEIQ